MDDDFNTREAIARLFEFTREVNKEMDKLSPRTIKKILALYHELGENILGLSFQGGEDSELVEKLIALIVSIRDEARNKKDWTTSDKIRDKLEKLEISLEDKKGESNWHKK